MPKDVDAYIASAPKKAQPMLRQLRRIIRAAAPKAVERLSYGMPYYSLNGRLVYFAAFKNHCSLFPANATTLKVFAKELRRFETSKGTVRFPIGKPIPVTLVRRIVKARVKENEAKQKA